VETTSGTRHPMMRTIAITVRSECVDPHNFKTAQIRSKRLGSTEIHRFSLPGQCPGVRSHQVGLLEAANRGPSSRQLRSTELEMFK
jgi:hypothetical protein